MSAQDVVKRFLPPLSGNLGDQQAQRLLDGLAAAGYAVVKLPEPVHRCDRDVAWISDDEIQVDYDTRDGVRMSWPDGTQVFGPWPADRALAVGAALIAAHAEAGERGE